MFNMMNNNQVQAQNYQSQQNGNINQNEILPNNININSILKLSANKNKNNASNSINNNLYPPKNLNNLFNNCNNQQQYPYTENKENCNLQNNYPNNNNIQQQQKYCTESKSQEIQMNQQNQNKTSNILSTSKKEKLEKNNNQNFISKNSGSMGFAFLNDYTSFTEKDNNKNKKNNNSKNNTELIELKEKYEKIVNDILNEEKNCLESHKSHIDNMVLTMKNEMNLINIVEQKSNVDEYVDEILNIFGEQENKINAMKQKLLGFKRLLKEENELSQKISALSENNNNNCNSNTKNENNSFDNNCMNEDKKSIKIDEINQEV